VVESDGVDFVDLSTTPRDAAYSTLRNEVKTEILVAFGAPESVLGNASGRTYENADAEENIFWRMTNQPLLAFVDMHLGSLTAGGNDDDLWVKHNTKNVRALQRPQRENDQRLLELWREGAIYLDELRKGSAATS
jgi:phage portal protein BeeE